MSNPDRRRARTDDARAPLSGPVATAVGLGLPETVARALQGVDESRTDPVEVAEALRTWRQVCGLPVSVLAVEHSDWVGIIGPMARSVLESAISALTQQDSAPLRRDVARLDAEFEAKTLNDPRADPTMPWWHRRLHH